jgi:hypothetical protein
MVNFKRIERKFLVPINESGFIEPNSAGNIEQRELRIWDCPDFRVSEKWDSPFCRMAHYDCLLFDCLL